MIRLTYRIHRKTFFSMFENILEKTEYLAFRSYKFRNIKNNLISFHLQFFTNYDCVKTLLSWSHFLCIHSLVICAYALYLVLWGVGTYARVLKSLRFESSCKEKKYLYIMRLGYLGLSIFFKIIFNRTQIEYLQVFFLCISASYFHFL